MADESLLEKVHDLSDLELACLLCLVSRGHCLISTPHQSIDNLVAELQLVARKTFGLQCVVIDCNPSTTLEDFASALLVPQTSNSHSPCETLRRSSYFLDKPHNRQEGQHRHSPGIISPLGTPHRATSVTATSTAPNAAPQIANFVLARNLSHAPQAVQIQALELLRTHRIFTRMSVQTAPKQFIFVPVLGAASGGEARLANHLNDFFFVAHWHDPEDGFINLEEDEGEEEDGGERERADHDTASTGSVVKKGNKPTASPDEALMPETDISRLALLSQRVNIDVDVIRYQMNIISFLRMHRAVSDGISPTATKHFEQLVRCLAPIHGLSFVTPALVRLAAKKVYLHRITITSPEKERSMQWGSSAGAVSALLEGIGPEEVIEKVLEMVTAPL